MADFMLKLLNGCPLVQYHIKLSLLVYTSTVYAAPMLKRKRYQAFALSSGTRGTFSYTLYTRFKSLLLPVSVFVQ